MATVARHKSTGKFYVVLGAGYGMWATSRPGARIGEFGVQDKSGADTSLCVCDSSGKIGWIETHEVEIVSIDGQSPEHLLSGGS